MAFKNIGKLIKENRLKVGLTQNELSLAMGYSKGQFISNVERGTCSIPNYQIPVVAKKLKVSKREIKEALVADFSESLGKW